MFFFFEGFHASRAEFKEAFPRGLADLSAPMSSLEQWLEQRLTILEASFVDLSASVPRQLCVSDDFGERTCITKVQFDDLLRRVTQMEANGPAPLPTTAISGYAQVMDVVVTTRIMPTTIVAQEIADRDNPNPALTGTITPITRTTAPIAKEVSPSPDHFIDWE